MDIPSLFMIPSAVSSGKVHSVFPNSTDADFDFNRDSDATRVNSEGLIERVGYYGSELVTNGDFSNGSTGWGLGSNWSVSGGKASCDGSASNSMSQATVLGIASTTFKITYNVLSISQGSLRITLGGVSGASRSEIGTYTDFITASSTDRLRIFADSNAIASIDNIVVNQVTGDRARLNYEIEGGLVNTKPSLLLEPQSTNIFLNSNNLSQWLIGAGLTVTTNLVTSPDGTKNADQIKKTSENYTYIRQSLTTGSVSVFSIFVKQGNYRYIGIRNNDSGHSVFDFETKTFVTSKADHNLSFKELPNGWFRLIDKRTISTNTSAFRGVALTLADGTELHSHIPLNAFAYVWGGQLENAATYSTSLIPTNGSTQTRAAETCNGAGTSSILPSEEGILYAEIASLTTEGAGATRLSINDGSQDNNVTIGYSASNTVRIIIRSSSSNQALITSTQTITDFLKIAVKYKANDFALYINGSLIGTDTSGSAPSGMNDVSFDKGDGTLDWYGKIRDIRVYNTKEMTDSEVDILLTKITS